MADASARIIRILLLEDSGIDAELALSSLSKGGIHFNAKRVETESDFTAELVNNSPDLILADFSLPAFDGVSALAIANKLTPEVPFLFVSGKMGEELAVECMQRGATDFVLKQRIGRLAQAVERALSEARLKADRKQAEEQLNILYEREQRAREVAESQAIELRKLNEELNQFAYAASHDLQEPLRNIGICSQMLLRKLSGAIDQEDLELLENIDQGTRRMIDLVKGLLAYSRHIHRIDAHRQEVNLSDTLNHILSEFEPAIKESCARILIDPLPAIWGNGDAIRCIFQNVISNSLKYRNGAAPEIHVSARAHQDDWIFQIRDNGIGFESKYADRIFGLFKRLHKDEFPGTGVGLALAKKMVEQHGGRIWAESEPGKGAIFSFTIPQRKRAAATV